MIDHWNCEHCKSYNDILDIHCSICHADKPNWITDEYQHRVEFRRGIFFGYGFYGQSVFINRRLECDNDMPMTEQEELFAKFYNQEKVLVKDMDITQLREHRSLLSQIALEAKARLVATDDEGRERSSKSTKKDWLVTTDSAQITSDAINAVKVRKARMSKMDKVREQLLTAGIDEETVNEMVAKMERRATEQTVKTITFAKPVTETGAVVVKIKRPDDEVKEPFNPASLFGPKE